MSSPNKKAGNASNNSNNAASKSLPSVNAKSGVTAAKKPADTKKNSSSTPKLPAISPTKPAAEVTATESTVVEATSSEPIIDAVPPPVLETPIAFETVTVESKPPEIVAPVEPPPIINGNGMVVLIYEQYNEEFPIINGSTTQENIDEVYCLSFVMPNCLVHLSKHKPVVKNKMESDGVYDDLFMIEEPRGTYQRLEAGNTYYVYVEQEEAQLKRDQEQMKQRAKEMEGGGAKAGGGVVRDDGRVMESCSCLYGNPCVDEYGCKDWDNRYAIATKNGWKGF